MLANDQFIIPSSYSFPLFNIMTLLFIYAKNTSDLYVRWSIILIPTLSYLVIQIIRSLKDLFFFETHDMKLTTLEIKLILINKLTRIIFGTVGVLFCLFLSEYLDFLDFPPYPKTEFTTTHLYILAFLILFVYFAYSIIIRKMIEMEQENIIASNEKVNMISIFMNSIFSILGNSMTICSTGACSSIYVSTISAFFSAFGITIVDWLPYLRYIAVIFIVISIFSLYSAKKSLLYVPFIICLIGSTLIMSSMIYFDNNIMLYLGNLLMIIAAFRNAKVNKAGFGRKIKEQV